jgi:hypothetical protein
MVFDGTENWILGTDVATNNSAKSRFKINLTNKPLYINANTISKLVATHYETGTSNETYLGSRKCIANNAGAFLIYDYALLSTEEPLSAFKVHLAELYANGKPLIIEYALAEPIETDISTYLGNDNFIAVEGGGSIKAVNEYEYDAPSTINYLTKWVGEQQ